MYYRNDGTFAMLKMKVDIVVEARGARLYNTHFSARRNKKVLGYWRSVKSNRLTLGIKSLGYLRHGSEVSHQKEREARVHEHKRRQTRKKKENKEDNARSILLVLLPCVRV